MNKLVEVDSQFEQGKGVLGYVTRNRKDHQTNFRVNLGHSSVSAIQHILLNESFGRILLVFQII